MISSRIPSSGPTRRRAAAVTTVACALAVTAACVSSSGSDPTPDRDDTYLPGRVVESYLPRTGNEPDGPVVVLVPGGAWRTADPSGLRPLAARLARRGVPTMAITYRAAEAGVRLPQAVADIRCAAAYAARGSSAPTQRPVVLVGHSSGAHLAALAVLAPVATTSHCPYPPADVVGLVGLAGPYDATAVSRVLEPLVGVAPEVDPDAWHLADPLALAEAAPDDLRVLLLHGGSDDVVPSQHMTRFASALRQAGADVTTTLLDGADHAALYSPDVVAVPLLRWLRAG